MKIETKRKTKSAIEMFEDLGYTKVCEESNYEDYEKKSQYGTTYLITIYKNKEYEKLSYPFNDDWNVMPEAITEAEDKAIHKRLKEIKERESGKRYNKHAKDYK